METQRDAAFLKSFIKEEIYLIQKERPTAASDPMSDNRTSELRPNPAPAAEAIIEQGKLVVILKKDLPDLEPTQKELLDKILLAVRAVPATTRILSEAAFKERPDAISHYEQVISFGVDLPQVPSRYQPVKRDNQQLLVSDSLAALEQAIALKGKLWQAMKVMFGA